MPHSKIIIRFKIIQQKLHKYFMVKSFLGYTIFYVLLSKDGSDCNVVNSAQQYFLQGLMNWNCTKAVYQS